MFGFLSLIYMLGSKSFLIVFHNSVWSPFVSTFDFLFDLMINGMRRKWHASGCFWFFKLFSPHCILLVWKILIHKWKKYRKVTNKCTSSLVTTQRIFSILMQGKFDAYLLWCWVKVDFCNSAKGQLISKQALSPYEP